MGLEGSIPGLWNELGTWLAFSISLAIFSAAIRENGLSRLAQYLLVGVGLGYAVVLAWQNVLQPRLFLPLLSANDDWMFYLPPLILGLILWIGGVDRIRLTRSRQPLERWSTQKQNRLVDHLRGLAVIPVALLIGVGVGVGIAGTWQGTLVPQALKASQLSPANVPSFAPLLTGLLTLLITTGTILFLAVDPKRHLPLPAIPQTLIRFWIGLGQRAIWLVAGIIFARLLASRFTLLTARLMDMMGYLDQTGIGRSVGSIWRMVFGG